MRWLAHVTAAAAVAIFLLVIGFAIAGDQVSRVFTAVPYLAVPFVGLVVARREPRNAVAWAFLGSSVLLGLDSLGGTLALHGVRRGWPDRAVHRARYDATRIVDTFATRVGAQVDAAALDAVPLETVQTAVAPATASVWLAPTAPATR